MRSVLRKRQIHTIVKIARLHEAAIRSSQRAAPQVDLPQKRNQGGLLGRILDGTFILAVGTGALDPNGLTFPVLWQRQAERCAPRPSQAYCCRRGKKNPCPAFVHSIASLSVCLVYHTFTGESVQTSGADFAFYSCISFCRMASSAGQKSYCGISAGVIQRRSLCSKSCGTPPAITAW